MSAQEMKRRTKGQRARSVRPRVHGGRRMLAHNVVCLFSEERPPVKQLPGFKRWRRGRSVYLQYFASGKRIGTGSFVEFTHPKCAHNFGKIGVVVDCESPNKKNEWTWMYQVRAVDGQFAYIRNDEPNDEPQFDREVWAPAESLRRVWTGGGRYNARLWEGRA